MELVKVWDKDGQMFEVSILNGHDVVNHLGWTRSPPAAKKEVVEAPVAEAAVEASVDAEAAVDVAEDADETNSSEASEAVDAPKRGRPRKAQ